MHESTSVSLSKRLTLALSLIACLALLGFPFTLAHASDQYNGPFGPQMQCYDAIQGFSSIDSLSPSAKVRGMTPVLMEVPSPPAMLALQQESARSNQSSILDFLKTGSMSLHIFNASGEFDAAIPVLVDAGDRACVDGVSFPDGKRAVVYNSYGTGYSGEKETTADNLSIYATIVASSPGSTCESLGYKKNRIAVAHQVGMAGQQSSESLLNGELADVIRGVHSEWNVNTAAAKRRKENPIRRRPIPAEAYNPKTGWLSAQANKTALQSCSSALSDSEFQSMRALVTQEQGKFDKAQAPGSNSNSSPNGSSGAASVY